MTSFFSIQGRRARETGLFRLTTAGDAGAATCDVSVKMSQENTNDLTSDFAFVGCKYGGGTDIPFEGHVASLAAVRIGRELERRTSDAIVMIAIEPGTRWIIDSTIVELSGCLLAFEPSLAATKSSLSVKLD